MKITQEQLMMLALYGIDINVFNRYMQQSNNNIYRSLKALCKYNDAPESILDFAESQKLYTLIDESIA